MSRHYIPHSKKCTVPLQRFDVMVGGVRLLKIDSPPLNTLTKEVRLKLSRELQTLVDDPSCEVILMVSSVHAFSVGADIKELASRSHRSSDLDAMRAYVTAYHDHNVKFVPFQVLLGSVNSCTPCQINQANI